MALDQQTELSRAETDAVLARNETGVLSLARGDEPYAIPISYGYDAESRTVFLRLVSTPDSEKRAFLSSSPAVRLVVSEESPPEYRSVVAQGTLTEISTDEMTVERIEQFGDAKRPLFEIWGADKPDLRIQLYECDATTISGRCIELDHAAYA
ncbi:MULTISPECIES: pyridoxamine 5'-phosphate oxidase family protein [Halobacterium]|uniref:FMN-binding domain protein n=4 Tax=Halobacterium salinarum TaxID=2242 RepID=Q9HPS8_HALSA|nr:MULTISPECIES: pyridoxamine 5'-phosphate oxidase family protein [Halobacterium]AAG19789.1 hypothetical protein VNG_1487H [Halobacterium salinarum NRC-1]MBB6088792.1 hypothetical protein [Halobacterium salinarum]MCF2165301.1 pyridoxamine 5'-phosphate oxidase family protein [Halobacterium salinarum]MCF2167890.1 pyridoxamine 5'-phosphate oxidase family protein [Halobacterium salinarum]MCF2206308.1 pyridoxamine 5'-phosphate oxidase family protein [Halobacterium salinarum]